jgi:IS30 family transposase
MGFDVGGIAPWALMVGGPPRGRAEPMHRHYRPASADRRVWARKLRGSKIERSTDLRACIEDRLAMGWSPQQIAGQLELENAE